MQTVSQASTATPTATVVTSAKTFTQTSGPFAQPNPSTFGQAITFTANVTASGTASGTVEFREGASLLGTGTLGSGAGCPGVQDVAGQACLVKSDLAPGTHTINAFYLGNATFEASNTTANPVRQTVNQASTATATATVVTSSSATAIPLTQTVTPPAGIPDAAPRLEPPLPSPSGQQTAAQPGPTGEEPTPATLSVELTEQLGLVVQALVPASDAGPMELLDAVLTAAPPELADALLALLPEVRWAAVQQLLTPPGLPAPSE
jgi:hypothetical protein